MSAKEKVLVGTSGYYYRDWVGKFYPAGTRAGGMLDVYSGVFPALEINSTYYGLATPSRMTALARKLPAGYVVAVKTFKSLTHGARSLSDAPACKEAMAPLEDAGLECLFLSQFPQSFQFGRENLDYVRRLIEALRPFPAAVEFRHASWLNERVLDAVREEEGVFVNVDEPPLPGLMPPSAHSTHHSWAYVRFHGRNASGWWGGDRYDYHYSQEELADWLPKTRELSAKSAKVLVFFNNCHGASAALNALDFARLLGMRVSSPQTRRPGLFDPG